MASGREATSANCFVAVDAGKHRRYERRLLEKELNPLVSFRMSHAVGTFIAIFFLILILTYIIYIVCYHVAASPPLLPERNVDTATISRRPELTYAEAISQDPRAVGATCCSICLVDYEEEEEAEALRLLPECGHLFHATCVDPWLLRRPTCPLCRSLVVFEFMQTPLAEA
ncbi:RING-H2 finger protein ATL39-like [Dendrobium catenatum]|uniref:RING-H2 finger protein ATL39-like n=1 Tax=Dendrobium catenatum TaxID=906689 RepID=UPI0009F65B76|nr:RING-H2 finger protein ATL39-like [Dendrobium catenatum]